ncbi:MAG: glycosyltransferase family 39 protein [Burkholderiales bacterium]
MSAATLAVVLCTVWTLAGLVGHDPWKPDEAYSFGLVYHMLRSGDWVVPMLAGEPFLEKPPLFYLTAALFAKALSPVLSLPDAARLATGFFIGATLGLVALCARELLGRDRGALAALALIGCLGLPVRAHQLITDVSLLASFALALYGLALCLRRPWLGGALLGTGAGVGFMSKGLLAPSELCIVAIVLPLLAGPWRTRRYLATLAAALVAVTPWVALWPWLLYRRAPDLFHGGCGTEPRPLPRSQRFQDRAQGRMFYLTILPWYAWPFCRLHSGRCGGRGFGGVCCTRPCCPDDGVPGHAGRAERSHTSAKCHAMPMLLPCRWSLPRNWTASVWVV